MNRESKIKKKRTLAITKYFIIIYHYLIMNKQYDEISDESFTIKHS